MEIHEIYLNQLFPPDELYKETANKLGCGSISGKDELMGCLMGFTEPHEFRLYVSDEDVENETVSEITDVFKTCDANSHMVSTEIFVDEFLNLIENRQECHIVLPYVTRIMQEIAIAQERMVQ